MIECVNLLQRTHLEGNVHSRAITEENGKKSFEHKCEIEDVIFHSLLKDRVLSSFADDQVCPLNYNNRHEECSVAGVLESFPLTICLMDTSSSIQELKSETHPFLTIRIFQIIHPSGVPKCADTQQSMRKESVLSHDDEV